MAPCCYCNVSEGQPEPEAGGGSGTKAAAAESAYSYSAIHASRACKLASLQAKHPHGLHSLLSLYAHFVFVSFFFRRALLGGSEYCRMNIYMCYVRKSKKVEIAEMYAAAGTAAD